MKPGLLMLPSAVSDSRVHNILPNKIDTDFQFSRASAATRVNHQGLIENVGYFSDELVQNGNFSELGPELSPAADFGTSDFESNPSSGTAVNNPNGTLIFTNSTSTGTNVQLKNRSITTTKTYKIQFTISNYVAGTFRMSVGNQITSAVSANGSYTFYVEYTAGLDRNYFYTNNSTLTVSNISVKEVDPDGDWALDTDWSYGNNKATFDYISSTRKIYQDNLSLDSSKNYKLKFTIQDVISGTPNIWIGDSSGTQMMINYTDYVAGSYNLIVSPPSNSTTLAFWCRNADFSITNISLVEVQGDKPRLDYEPLNPTCPHLLLEPQSTNLLTQSNGFNNWTSSNLTLTSGQSSAITALDEAWLFTATGTTANVTLSVSSSGANTLSVFAKAGTQDGIFIRFSGSSSPRAFFNLSNGTLISETNTTSTNVEAFKDGWYRLSITGTDTVTDARIYVADSTGNFVSSGNIYVQNAQLEQQSYATSYIPTAGATVTRVAETCTNAGDVNTFNSEEGVLYAETATLSNNTGAARILSLSDNTTNNSIRFEYQSTANQIRVRYRNGGASQNDFIYTLSNEEDFNKIAFKYKVNDFSLYVNGTEVATDTSGSVVAANTFTTLKFLRGDDSNTFYGKVKSLATYNRALTDTELYTITSTQYSAYSGMVAALGNYTIPC